MKNILIHHYGMENINFPFAINGDEIIWNVGAKKPSKKELEKWKEDYEIYLKERKYKEKLDQALFQAGLTKEVWLEINMDDDQEKIDEFRKKRKKIKENLKK